MIYAIQKFGEKLLKFIVSLICKVSLLATLISVAVCIALFFMCFFNGYPLYALLSLAGMLCFLYTNKQF